MKKILSIAVLAGLVFATSVPVFAIENKELPYVDGLGYEVEVLEADDSNPTLYNYDSGWKDFLGGEWRHGVGSRYVWSKYDHVKKTHKTTVEGAGWKRSSSDWIEPGKRAKASWEKAWFGNKAWADVK